MAENNQYPAADGSGNTQTGAYDIDKESIRISHDFKIEYIKLYPFEGDPVDLTNVFIRLNIFEDIFNNFLTGNISILDSWDLPNLLPIIGEEKLEISFIRPGTKTFNDPMLPGNFQDLEPTKRYTYKFRVVKLTDRKLVRDKTQTYTLHLAAFEFLNSKKKKVSKAFNDVLYSDIVKEVFNEFLKIDLPIEIEPTKYLQKLCIPNWSPAQAINIIASRSIPESKTGSNYVFWQTMDKFHFKSIESLYEQKAEEVWLYQLQNVYVIDSLTNRTIKEDVRNIDSYEIAEDIDVLANLSNGMYGSKLLTVDPVRRIFEYYDYDYLKDFEQSTHLEKNKLCSDKSDALGAPMSRYNVMETNKDHDKVAWIAGREPGIKPLMIEEYVQKRQSQFQQLNNLRFNLTMPGNPERNAGDVIYFSMPNAMGDPKRFGAEEQKYMSGRFLITAIRHRIERNSYYQDVEIIKDSLLKEPEYLNPVDIYKETW